jgi:hypothetical protein
MAYVAERTKAATTWVDTTVNTWVGGVKSVVNEIGKGIDQTIKQATNTVNAILKDPVPTLLAAGGAYVGIPPYITMAAITAARGGNLEDVAKSAALSYATSSFMNNTQMGADIQNYTSNAWAGDFTDSMMDTFSLTPDQAIQVAKVSTAALSTSVASGINAALTGKPIDQALTSGFTSGLINAGTSSYFDSVNKDSNWGFSPTALNLMKGATSTALNAAVNGKVDPAVAVGNYIAYATLNLGQSNLATTAREAYKRLTAATTAADTAQGAYTSAKADVDAKTKEGETLRNEINTAADNLNARIRDEYNPVKATLDAKLAENASAVAIFNEQKKIFDDSKWAYNNYETYLTNSGYIVDDKDQDGNILNPYKLNPITNMVSEYAPVQHSFAVAANDAATKANAAAATANTTGTAAQKIYDDNKAIFDGVAADSKAIDTKMAKLTEIKDEVETPSGTNLAQKLKDAATEYQSKYTAWTAAKTDADSAAKTYDKALAAVATREATIDALNDGIITPRARTADGWVLSNGMTLSPEGTFLTANDEGVLTSAFADAGDAASSTINIVRDAEAQDKGWDNVAQKNEAATAGYTDPEKYDAYLTDRKANEDAVREGWDNVAQKSEAKAAGYTDPAKYDDYLTDKTANETAIKEGWDSLDEKKAAATAGYTDPTKYDTYLADKTANETAKTEGWTGSAQKAEAAAAGYTDPEKYDTYLTDKTANEAAVSEGWTSSKQKAEAAAAGYTNPAVYDNYLTDKQANTDAIAQGWTGSDQKAEAATLGYTDPTEYTNYLSGLNTGGDDTIISGGGDDTVEGGGDGKVDTTCADGFHWDEGRQMCIADDDVDTTCADGFHWDEGRQMCIADTDTEEESTDCPDGYLYNLSTKSCDPIGGGPSLPPIKLDKKKDKVTTSTTTTNTGNTTITTGGNTTITTGSNTAVVTGSGTTALNSDQILSLLNVFGGSGGQQQQQVPYTPAQVPVADIKSYYNTIRGIAGENLLPESKEEKDKSNIDNLFAGGGTVNKSYDDVIRGIAGERLLDQPKEKKEKSSIEEMFFEGGTVDDLLRILRG